MSIAPHPLTSAQVNVLRTLVLTKTHLRPRVGLDKTASHAFWQFCDKGGVPRTELGLVKSRTVVRLQRAHLLNTYNLEATAPTNLGVEVIREEHKERKPYCLDCPTCGAPAVSKLDTKLLASRTKHVDLLTPLKDLVRCIRDFQLGDYSPLMDEIFDAEYAIRMAENKPKKGLDYGD